MSRAFGKESNYLIRNQWGNLIFALTLIALALAWDAYVYFYTDYRNWGILGILIFAPIIWLIIIAKRLHLKAERFHQGREGEKDVWEYLSELPDVYCKYRDVQIPGMYGNLDLVVVGPTGLFVIEVKSHYGKIEFDGKSLIRNRRYFEKDFLLQVRKEAEGLYDYIKLRYKEPFTIHRVIVFSSERSYMRFGTKSLGSTGVHVVKKGFLRELIEEREKILNLAQIRKFQDILDQLIKVE